MCLAVHPNYELPNLFMIICDNYIVGANGTERIHKTERKVFRGLIRMLLSPRLILRRAP